jgi:hypothetical protein
MYHTCTRTFLMALVLLGVASTLALAQMGGAGAAGSSGGASSPGAAGTIGTPGRPGGTGNTPGSLPGGSGTVDPGRPGASKLEPPATPGAALTGPEREARERLNDTRTTPGAGTERELRETIPTPEVTERERSRGSDTAGASRTPPRP